MWTRLSVLSWWAALPLATPPPLRPVPVSTPPKPRREREKPSAATRVVGGVAAVFGLLVMVVGMTTLSNGGRLPIPLPLLALAMIGGPLVIIVLALRNRDRE